MGEVHLRCQFGQRKKDGKIVRPATCTNRASGVFLVHLVRGKARPFLLCAQCAFDKMPNRVRCLPPPEDAPKGTPPTYFRDVARVELMATLGTDFDQTSVLNIPGYKHWVERKNQLPERLSIPKVKQISPRQRTVDMDLSQYVETLRRHDDGK